VRARAKHSRVAWLAACAALLGACGPGDPPENPTWAEVEPILRAQCTGCHGATATETGSSYRFDFYDMSSTDTAPNPCGDAATILSDVTLARGQADKIVKAITSVDENVRPAMPPVPAPYLTDNEAITIMRWTANPIRGDKPASNRPPQISVEGTSVVVDDTMDINLIVSDPEGDPVVGLIKVGDQVLRRMDRSGAFHERFDTSAWPEGTVGLTALVCDGWSLVSADLLEISVQHQPGAR
jgi:hypothetical protein